MAKKSKKVVAEAAAAVEVLEGPVTRERATARVTALEAEVGRLEKVKWNDPEYDSVDAKTAAALAELEKARSAVEAIDVREMPRAEIPGRQMVVDVTSIGLDLIVTTGNHRLSDDDAEVARLARSMGTLGQQTPIGVRDREDGTYELIYGSRRLAAARQLGWATLTAQVYPSATSPAEVELRRTAENFARREVGPAEQALAVARMIEAVDRGIADPAADASAQRLLQEVQRAGGVHEYVGQLLGRPVGWVRDHAYVTRLGGVARELLLARRLDLGHARELAKLGDPDRADIVAGTYARDPDGSGGVAVESLRKVVEAELASLSRAVWNLEAVFPQLADRQLPTHACNGCRFNTKSDPDLFGAVEQDKAGRCSWSACYLARAEIAEKDLASALAKVEKRAASGKAVNPMEFVPVTVAASKFERKAKAVLAGETKSAAGNGAAAPEKSAEQKAREKHDRAEYAWREAANDRIEKALRSKPLVRVAWELGSHEFTAPYRVGYTTSPADEQKKHAKCLRALEQRAGFDVLDTVVSPTLKTIETLGARDRYVNVGTHGVIPEALVAIAEKLGVKLDPPPVYEPPVPKPEKPASPAKKSAKK